MVKMKKSTNLLQKIPRGTARQVLVIDFGQTMTEIALMECQGNKFKLLHYDIKKIENKEQSDEIIVCFINEFFARTGILVRDVVMNISDADSVIIKYLIIPHIPDAEVLGTIKWKLKEEEFPFSIEEALGDWQVVKEYTENDGGKKKGVIFIALKKETVDKYLNMIYQCGLDPVAVSYASFNYSNLFSYIPNNPPVVATLDIDHADSTISIYSENKLNFVRRLPISWVRLTESLTKIIVTDQGKIELSYEEADNIRRQYGIPEQGKENVMENIPATHLHSLMRPVLETLARDLLFSFDYFTRNYEMVKPTLLYLTGGGASLRNLDKYLSKELKMDVVCLRYPANVDTSAVSRGSFETEDQNSLVSAVGAVMRSGKSINLLPREIRKKKVELIQMISLRLVGFTIGAILLLLLIFAQLRIQDLRKRLDAARLHWETMGGMEVINQRYLLIEEMMTTIQHNKVPVDGLLKTLAYYIPQQILVKELSYDQNSHQMMLKGTINPQGNAAEPMLIEWIKTMEGSPFFTEITLLSTRQAGHLKEFDISCEVVHE
jgi:type IV pilus assembly protein PilM